MKGKTYTYRILERDAEDPKILHDRGTMVSTSPTSARATFFAKDTDVKAQTTVIVADDTLNEDTLTRRIDEVEVVVSAKAEQRKPREKKAAKTDDKDDAGEKGDGPTGDQNSVVGDPDQRKLASVS